MERRRSKAGVQLFPLWGRAAKLRGSAFCHGGTGARTCCDAIPVPISACAGGEGGDGRLADAASKEGGAWGRVGPLTRVSRHCSTYDYKHASFSANTN